MIKTLLCDLKKKMFIRSTLLGMSGLGEILGLNDEISEDEVLLEIIKMALREFELYEPLVLEMPVNSGQLGTCYGKPGWSEIKPNFTLYLKCLIDESQIILLPTSLPYWRIGDGYGSYSGGYYGSIGITPTFGNYQPFSDYQAPYIYTGDLGIYDSAGNQRSIYIKATVARPIVPSFTPDKKFNTADQASAIYWIDVETGGARGNFFMDLCMVHLLDYIRQLKASLQLPSVPVSILDNVDSAYQELRSRCDQYALQSGWYGELLT